jgi:hypothetical protein
MILPKIAHPIYDLEIPSTKMPIKVRPMLAKEEKVLLMAKETADDNEILLSIKQVVNNCILAHNIDVDKLTIFDIEYMFIKLRAWSVSNMSEVSYRDSEDYEAKLDELAGKGMPQAQAEAEAAKQSVHTFNVDLNNISVKFEEGIDKMIKIDDDNTIRMKYPSASLYTDKEFLNAENKHVLDILVRKSIDAIINKGTVINFEGVSKTEGDAFIDSLPIPIMEKVREWLTKAPTVYHEIKYKNKQGNDRSIVLKTLTDFFTLR